MKYIDLHTHSTASDGGDTPEEVVRKAKALNLAAVALAPRQGRAQNLHLQRH